MSIIIRQTITGTATAENFPTGREVVIQTDADLQLEFWNPAAGEFADPLSAPAPQAVVVCPSAKVRITTATTANVNVALSNAVNADAVKTVSQALTVVQQSHARKNLDLWAYTYPIISGVNPSGVEGSGGNVVRFIIRKADGTRVRVDFIYLAGDYDGSVTASDTRLPDDGLAHVAALEWSMDSWYLTTSEGIVSAPGGHLDDPASLEWPASVESVVSQIVDTGMIALFASNPEVALWFNPAFSLWTRFGPNGDDLVRLSGTQTVGGAKTFSGQMELTGQSAANPTSAMTRALADARHVHSRLASNFTVNNTAAPTATGLEVPLGIGTWEITGCATAISATNTPGCRFRFAFSGSLHADGYDRAWMIQSTGGGPNAQIAFAAVGSNLDSIATSSQHNTIFRFTVRVAAAGTLTLEFSQKTATAENSTLSVISNLAAHRISF